MWGLTLKQKIIGNMKKILPSLAIILCTSCASTHGNFISEHKDAWIDGYSAKSGRADRGLLFCRANIKEDGLADPICFETRFEEYEDEKPRAEEQKRKEEKLKKKEPQVTKEVSTSQ